MKVLYFIFALVFGWVNCQAQDATLALDTTMFSPDDQINLTDAKGWVYHPGHNPAWARPGWNTADWARRRPDQLSVQDADRTGRAEGWFRLNIRLDSTFMGLLLSLKKGSWAALDVYVDGRLLDSFGNTGTNGKPYADNHSAVEQPVRVLLAPEQTHLIAIHFVDYASPFFHQQLKYELTAENTQLIRLTGPRYYEFWWSRYRRNLFSYGIWFSVSFVLTLLFWLIPFQNQEEKKVIRLLIVWGSLLTFHHAIFILDVFDPPYIIETIAFRLIWFIYYLSVTFVIQAVAHIFGKPLPRPLVVFVFAISIIGGLLSIYQGSNTPGTVGNFLLLLVFLQLLITSWKQLKGAQWGIVVGAILYIVLSLVFGLAWSYDVSSVSLMGVFISLPLAFAVYIALRFKEIFVDIREKAAAVLQVTEEKRELLANWAMPLPVLEETVNAYIHEQQP